jgi:glucan phosphoethanolaminetransferase (alkaline phosphatase superfamily)
MELALNLVWTALAAAMCWLWGRYARREGHKRWAQFVSLALVLFMMFVVITMYDDMAMAQNPAETRCFQREDDLGAHAHAPLHPAVASIPTPAAGFPFNTFRFAVPGSLLVPNVKVPALSSIQNRPPPAV